MPTKLPYQFIDGLDQVPRDQLYRNFEEIQRAVNAITASPVQGDTSGMHVAPLRLGPSIPYGTGYGSIDVHSRSYSAAGNYVLLANAGETHINAPTGGEVTLRINNGNRIRATGSYATLWEGEVFGSLHMRDNWVRSHGSFGWYNQTHGGGIFMEDNVWVKVFGNKAFYAYDEIKSETRMNVANIAFMGGSGFHGGFSQHSHFAMRASAGRYGMMQSGDGHWLLLSAAEIWLRHENGDRLHIHANGVSTGGVYFSTRGASIYLKNDGDNTHRIYWHGTDDGVRMLSWAYVGLECVAHDHAVFAIAQTRHVNRGNNAWRYSDAAGHTNFSDPKGKDDIKPLKEALGKQRQKLKEIRPIKFKFKPEMADPEGDRDHFGFSADELPEEVIHRREMADGRVDKLFNPAGVLALLWQITDEISDSLDEITKRLEALENGSRPATGSTGTGTTPR